MIYKRCLSFLFGNVAHLFKHINGNRWICGALMSHRVHYRLESLATKAGFFTVRWLRGLLYNFERSFPSVCHILFMENETLPNQTDN